MPVPPGGSRLGHAIAGLRSGGVDTLVSLLTRDQIDELGVAAEGDVCAEHGIEYLWHPIVDHEVPRDVDASIEFARGLLGRLESGRAVAVHCFAGIGRSGTIIALTMVLAGFELEGACWRISQARGIPCPETFEQMQWLREIEASGKLG